MDRDSKLRGLQGDELQEAVNSLTAAEIAKEVVIAEKFIEEGWRGVDYGPPAHIMASPMIRRGEEILKAIRSR